MSLTFNSVNINDPAEFVDGIATATDGKTQVKDWRMKYFIHVIANDAVANKKRNNDTSDITINDLFRKQIPSGLTMEFNDVNPRKGNVYNIYVDSLLERLFELKDRSSRFNASVIPKVDARLRNALSELQNVNTNEAKVAKLIYQFLLDDKGNTNANNTVFDNVFGRSTTPSGSLPRTLYYDAVTRAVGFPINTVKWRYNTLKEDSETLIKKESLNFDSLFNSGPAATLATGLDFEFVNVNGKLVKKYKDGRANEDYDLNAQVTNSSRIQGETCTNLGLNTPAECNNFFAKCQKDSIDDCNNFMSTLNKAGFLNLVKNLKYVDPLHVNWVVKKFDWPNYVKNGVRCLKSTSQWLNPNNYPDKSEAELMKKIRSNTNLVAFFDAVKATTDAFPAILNPNYTGNGVANPFANQVNKSKVGKFGLKALMTQNPLSLSEYKAAFLKAQNMTNNNMTNVATALGIRVLLPSPFAFALQSGGGDNVVPNGQVQAYLNKLDDGTAFVPSADYTKKLWTGLMDNLRNRYSMDVSAIDNDVSNYLSNLKDYEGRVHKAIAYVKVFTDNLVEDQANGNQNVPYQLDRKALEELTTVRDKLVSKTFNKNNTFFKNLFELLDRLEKKLDGKN
jgi:hypothetical protein